MNQLYRCVHCKTVFFASIVDCAYCKRRSSVSPVEREVFTSKGSGPKKPKLPKEPTRPKMIRKMKIGSVPRQKSLIPEFDELLGGGPVVGAAYLVYGVPGSGKSTVLLQAFDDMNNYIWTGEESSHAIAERSRRLGGKGLARVMKTSSIKEIQELMPRSANVSIIDSIQTVRITDAVVSDNTIRETSKILCNMAQETRISLFIIAHSTKDEGVAGPQTLPHDVDCVIELQVDNKGRRFMQCTKNRFGPSHVKFSYVMTDQGIVFTGKR